MKPNRETPFERTMTANLGLTLDDMAVAPIIFRKAVKKGQGDQSLYAVVISCYIINATFPLIDRFHGFA